MDHTRCILLVTSSGATSVEPAPSGTTLHTGKVDSATISLPPSSHTNLLTKPPATRNSRTPPSNQALPCTAPRASSPTLRWISFNVHNAVLGQRASPVSFITNAAHVTSTFAGCVILSTDSYAPPPALPRHHRQHPPCPLNTTGLRLTAPNNHRSRVIQTKAVSRV